MEDSDEERVSEDFRQINDPSVSDNGKSSLKVGTEKASLSSLDISLLVNKIKIDFIKDLNKEIDPEDLKEFVRREAKVGKLTHKVLERLIQEGAAVNRFINLKKSTLEIMSKVLEIPVDKDIDHRKFKLN